ncbi:MAG: magnesium/cobalt transporter CorA [Anaerolineae bacterium]
MPHTIDQEASQPLAVTHTRFGTPDQSKPTRFRLVRYNEDEIEERELALDECGQLKTDNKITWIHVAGTGHPPLLETLGQCLGLHPLVVEDIGSPQQRPKIEDYEDYVYIVLRSLTFDGDAGQIVSEQVSIILGPGVVLSVQQTDTPLFETVRAHLRAGKGRMRRLGADYLAYVLVDTIVDGYFGLLQELAERIDDLEEDLITHTTSATLETIHDLKRELLLLRTSIWPTREVISSLQRNESWIVTDSTAVYLRDVYDHTIQIVDTLEVYREIVSGMLDIYLSSISNRMNEVMKVLTVISTIFIPLTFVAGVYGMNFHHMPELSWRWGYPASLMLMLAIAATMLMYFRRKRWL